MLNFAEACRKRIEQQLTILLTQNITPIYQDIYQCMSYSVLGGGKRFRSTLVYAICEALGFPLQQADSIAMTVELIHSYSLIHDDLPAMDNDILRRGKPSAHIKFGEANAILIGDALQSLAFEVLAKDQACSSATKIKMLQIIAQASGAQGMVAGQIFDLTATGQHISVDELQNIHHHKTGALIKTSVLLGAYAALNTDHLHQQIKTELIQYGENLGLAFQVQDDILDATLDTSTLGKTRGKDYAQNKATYVTLMGLKPAQKYAQDLIKAAKNALSNWDHKADNLRQLADFIVERKF